MNSPVAKNRLHATRVDRIAIVDRPAVPDAEIVVFKRFTDNVGDSVYVKQYNEYCDKMKSDTTTLKGMFGELKVGFVIRASQVAVDSLQEEVWEALYTENNQNDALAHISKAFADFEDILVNVLADVVDKAKAETDTQKLTKQDVVDSFARGMQLTVISESMTHLKNHISFLLVSQKDLADPMGTIKAIVQNVKSFIMDNITEIVKKTRDGEKPVFEKAGRIISRARLRKIQEAIIVLTNLVDETNARYSDKSITEEAEDMDELKKMFDALSATVQDVVGVLKSQGHLLTEEEKKKVEEEKIEAEKKAEQEKIEAEKKAEAEKVEADEKAKVEAEEAEKRAKEQKEIEELAKKEKEELKATLEKFSKTLEEFTKFKEKVSKKLGVKTSLSTEENEEKSEKGDVFGDAVKGRNKK